MTYLTVMGTKQEEDQSVEGIMKSDLIFYPI